jgi:O-antigen ligase
MPGFLKFRLGNTFNIFDWGGRIELYEAALKIFYNFPVFGAGVGMTEKLLSRFGPPSGYPGGYIHLHAHNSYLEILSEMGIFGFSAFIGIFIFFIFLFLTNKNIWKHNNTENDVIILALSASIFSTLVLAHATTVMIIDLQGALTFWLLFGLVFGLLRQDANPSTKN